MTIHPENSKLLAIPGIPSLLRLVIIPMSYAYDTDLDMIFSFSAFHLAKPGTKSKPGMKSPISSASNTLFSSVRGPYSLSVTARNPCWLSLGFVDILLPRKLHLLLILLSVVDVDGTAVSS